MLRNIEQNNAVNFQNKQNNAWMYRTQTLGNNGDLISCANNTDCASWPGTTCNSQVMSWSESKGNQGNFCSLTHYPEMQGGSYFRKDTNQGGIGKACITDNECASGYSCNNTTDMFGKNIQQTGYCAQMYSCPDGDHYLGYPYNSGIPIVPPKEQNNSGRGYSTKDECNSNKLSQQDCVKDNAGKWFATYPGYCPVVPTLRQGNSATGQLPSSSMHSVSSGFRIPAYASNMASNSGSTLSAFTSWNINSNVGNFKEMSDPLNYELSINPK